MTSVTIAGPAQIPLQMVNSQNNEKNTHNKLISGKCQFDKTAV